MAFNFISGSVLERGHSLLVGGESSGNDDCFWRNKTIKVLY